MTLPAQDIVSRLDAVEACSDRPYAASVAADAKALISRLTADNEALRAERDDWRASATEFKDLTDEWQALADALAQEVERLRLPEGTLAKHGSTITIEFDNAEYALRAFDAIEYAMSREPVALANEEAGRE